MQLLRATLAGLMGLASLDMAAAVPTPASSDRRATQTLSDVVIFSPPSNAGWTDPRVLYARALQLSNGDLLATWENYSPEPPAVHFPVFKSTDGGASWSEIAQVNDTVNGWGLRYQPFLYELPSPIGDFPAGTLLLAGNSIPTDLSKTKIDVYASRDSGVTWEFVSSVASGGKALPNNGLTPVWEPFLMVYEGQLICYYSDQRDSNFGQKLTHQTTRDLLTWEPTVDDVTDPDYNARPGMPTLALLPDGNYILTYENCGPQSCNVSYRLAEDPLKLLEAPSTPLTSTAGTRARGSPYVVFSPLGGPNGTIVASCGTNSKIFVNRQLGAADAWEEFDVPQPTAYSRALLPLRGGGSELLIIGGGALPPSSTNKVSLSVVDLKTLIGA